MKKLISTGAFVAILILPTFALAAVGDAGAAYAPDHIDAGSGITLVNPLGDASLNGFLLSVLDFVIEVGTVVVPLMLVYVGFLFVTAQGKPEALNTAKKAFLWTLIGGLILLGARVIAETIANTVSSLG